MTMLPITIDELRADYGPSSFPTFEQIGRQRAQHDAMRQSLQQFIIETGTGPRIVTRQDDDRDADALEERVASLEAQLQHFVDQELEFENQKLSDQVSRQADTIKRLHAQVDVLRAQNRSLTDRALGLEGKRPPPGGALDDPKPTPSSIMFGEPLVPRRKAVDAFREEVACL